MTARVGSVLIPAHDEASVLKRCLDTLLDGMAPGELLVVIACNGCSDDTAEIARSSGHDVEVIEIPTPSKPAAIRAAERVAGSFPRIYLDADVELSGPAARAVLADLANGTALAARPPILYDSTRSSAVVRSYYRARSRVPDLMERLWGAGVYGLSESGRSRFAEYPDVIAEDLFVDQHFSTSEISIVVTDPVIVRVPRTSRALLRILGRSYRGNRYNRRDVGDGSGPRARRTSTTSVFRQVLAGATAGPGPALDALTFVAVTLAARVRARFATGTRWERDDSSRES